MSRPNDVGEALGASLIVGKPPRARGEGKMDDDRRGRGRGRRLHRFLKKRDATIGDDVDMDVEGE